MTATRPDNHGVLVAAESARNLDLILDDKASQSLLHEFAAYRDV